MLEYLKLSRRMARSLVLERGIDLCAQQAPKSSTSSCISCYRSPASDQIHFFQMNLWSRGIKRSDESLLTAINYRLLLRKSISSFLAAQLPHRSIQNIWKASTCTLVNDMQIRCKWYSWAETANIREIELPCLSVPEWVLIIIYRVGVLCNTITIILL